MSFLRTISNFEQKKNEKSQTSCKRGEEYYFKSRAKEKRSYKIIKNSKRHTKRVRMLFQKKS